MAHADRKKQLKEQISMLAARKKSQLENGLAVAVRNAVLKSLPASLMQKQAQAIDEFPNLSS
ncbi:hypothetical protein AB1L05_04665 [Cytobacillus horneckiae]|uniref:hypothetical protein n=1 Tax=Cytobacillus horneckiae TaxID=549687 RepID=UPI0039A10AF3